MLTEFGWKLFNINDERNMAEKIGVSRDFLSSVELGFVPLPDGFDEKIITAYQLGPDQANEVRLAFKRVKAREKPLIPLPPANNIYEYFWWSVEKPWNKKNKNGPFATENEAIADAKNKIRTKADVVIFKNLWLNSFHGYLNVALNCCEFNPTELVEDDE